MVPTVETFEWVKSLSNTYMVAHGLNDTSIKGEDWHGAGHENAEANAAIITSIITATILLVVSVFYLLYRVYKKDKRFTKDFRREYEDRRYSYMDDEGKEKYVVISPD